VNGDPNRIKGTIVELGKLHPGLASYVTEILLVAGDLTNGTAGTETGRVVQAREVHKNASALIRRKTKEMYAAMKEERENVEAYSAQLTNIIQEKEKQSQLQIKIYGLGL
jgi:hypothetical protein